MSLGLFMIISTSINFAQISRLMQLLLNCSEGKNYWKYDPNAFHM